MLTSPIKITPVPICSKTLTIIYDNLTVLMPRCTKTSFLFTQLVHTEIQTTCVMLFLQGTFSLGNGRWIPFCGLLCLTYQTHKTQPRQNLRQPRTGPSVLDTPGTLCVYVHNARYDICPPPHLFVTVNFYILWRGVIKPISHVTLLTHDTSSIYPAITHVIYYIPYCNSIYVSSLSTCTDTVVSLKQGSHAAQE